MGLVTAPMRVFVPRESHPGEARVAATPETVRRLVAEGFSVAIEAGAGARAHFPDGQYLEAGAQCLAGAEAAAARKAAKLLLAVRTPTIESLEAVPEEGFLIGLLAPYSSADAVKVFRQRRMTTLALELLPRISRAQSMDALSSQASVAGYKAALLGAEQLDKYFPLLMTAAGTVQPARVVVMGAGVAGLQALATARRLGAVVEVSDIRTEVKEQVESLGGRFIDVPQEESGGGEGGYARAVSEEFLAKQQALVAEHVASADVVITTALVPGRPAPRLLPRSTVERMRPGAVVIDLAIEQGGNCELSAADERVVHNGVSILAPSNLPAAMPRDASQLYARNVLSLVLHLAPAASLKVDLEDEILSKTILTHGGRVTHAGVAQALGLEEA